MFDIFYWMKDFEDCGFEYYCIVVQLWFLFGLILVDQLFLLFDILCYVEDFVYFVKDIKIKYEIILSFYNIIFGKFMIGSERG